MGLGMHPTGFPRGFVLKFPKLIQVWMRKGRKSLGLRLIQDDQTPNGAQPRVVVDGVEPHSISSESVIQRGWILKEVGGLQVKTVSEVVTLIGDAADVVRLGFSGMVSDTISNKAVSKAYFQRVSKENDSNTQKFMDQNASKRASFASLSCDSLSTPNIGKTRSKKDVLSCEIPSSSVSVGKKPRRAKTHHITTSNTQEISTHQGSAVATKNSSSDSTSHATSTQESIAVEMNYDDALNRQRSNSCLISQFMVASSPCSDQSLALSLDLSVAEYKLVQSLKLHGNVKRDDAIRLVRKYGADQAIPTYLSHYAEERFEEDLRKAQIQSEASTRKEMEHREMVLKNSLHDATNLMELFPNSIIIKGSHYAAKLPQMIQILSNVTSSENELRCLLAEILDLEKNAIRWYSQPAACYMGNVRDRLEQSIDCTNVSNCLRRMSREFELFKKVLQEEIKNLKSHLYGMPEVIGGVPIAFVKADTSKCYEMEEDGFEIVEAIDENGMDVEMIE